MPSSTVIPAQPGWFAALAPSTTKFPLCKQPVIGWLVCSNEEGDTQTVWPISINENRNTCWGVSDSYILVSPEGLFYVANDGPVFDNEADAITHCVAQEKAMDEHMAEASKRDRSPSEE